MANGKAPEKKALMTEPKAQRTRQGEVPPNPDAVRRGHWIWPLGLAMAGLGGAAAFMLRGCWHTHMSWPIKLDDEFSYQVCTNCGIKRLYDEKTFHAYGPYGYDLHELIARERTVRLRRLRKHTEMMARSMAKGTGEKATETQE
jgi:DNA-directed RNA polymerase subunit RPC12/RpoP